MAYQITAARDGEIIRAAYALNRETADQIYGLMIDRHPDSEVRLIERGDIVLASSGPRERREER